MNRAHRISDAEAQGDLTEEELVYWEKDLKVTSVGAYISPMARLMAEVRRRRSEEESYERLN